MSTATVELTNTLHAAVTRLRATTVPTAWLPVLASTIELLDDIAAELAWHQAHRVHYPGWPAGDDTNVISTWGESRPAWAEAVHLAEAILTATGHTP